MALRSLLEHAEGFDPGLGQSPGLALVEECGEVRVLYRGVDVVTPFPLIATLTYVVTVTF